MNLSPFLSHTYALILLHSFLAILSFAALMCTSTCKIVNAMAPVSALLFFMIFDMRAFVFEALHLCAC